MRSILFRRSLAEGTMLPDSSASTVNVFGRRCWPMAAYRSTLGTCWLGSTRWFRCTESAVGYGTVVVKMESQRVERRDERLMSTSSVFNRPYFLGPMRPPPKSGRESAHDHGRNLRQTVSSHPESLHSSDSRRSSHSKPPPGSRPTPSLTRQTRFLALSPPFTTYQIIS